MYLLILQNFTKTKYIFKFSCSTVRGSVTEYVLYFKCQRIYYNGSVTEYTNLFIFWDTCFQWDFHYNIFKDTCFRVYIQ